MSLSEREASSIISKKLVEARGLIRECELIADAAGVDFSWGGPAYGMGGYYTAKTSPQDSAEDDWESSSEGWMASSQSC